MLEQDLHPLSLGTFNFIPDPRSEEKTVVCRKSEWLKEEATFTRRARASSFPPGDRQRRPDAAVRHFGVDGGGFEAGMAQELLDVADRDDPKHVMVVNQKLRPK